MAIFAIIFFTLAWAIIVIGNLGALNLKIDKSNALAERAAIQRDITNKLLEINNNLLEQRIEQERGKR